MPTRFADLVYDPEARVLSRGATPVHLSPKAFELLGLLLESRPKAVAKREIHDRLWPQTFVSEATLAGVASELREALRDDPRKPRFLRTVHGFGYAFCGEATTAAPRPPGSPARRACRLIWDDREIALHEGDNLLGRTADAVAWIESTSVSRRHARIVVDAAGARIEDLGSKNGTRVGATRIEGPTPLKSGDRISLGSVVLKFVAFDELETRDDWKLP